MIIDNQSITPDAYFEKSPNNTITYEEYCRYPPRGDSQDCEIIMKIRSPYLKKKKPLMERQDMGELSNVIKTNQNVGELNINGPGAKVIKIDDSKLDYPNDVDRRKYWSPNLSLEENHTNLIREVGNHYLKKHPHGHKTWETIESRIWNLINYPIEKYRINLFTFEQEPEKLIDQLNHRAFVIYPKKAIETNRPNYGYSQLDNLKKAVNVLGDILSIDVSAIVKRFPHFTIDDTVHCEIPYPDMANKLVHYQYSSDRLTNVTIKTLLLFGFQSGLRPEELCLVKWDQIDWDKLGIKIVEPKKSWRTRNIPLPWDVLYHPKQPCLKNLHDIWVPRLKKRVKTDSNIYDGYIFNDPNTGKPFIKISDEGKILPDEDKLRFFLTPCKAVYKPFCPKIMRKYYAISTLIEKYLETGNWDIGYVTWKLGHKRTDTTKNHYLPNAQDKFETYPIDWKRAILKFHSNSIKMQRLRKQVNDSKKHQTESPYKTMVKSTDKKKTKSRQARGHSNMRKNL